MHAEPVFDAEWYLQNNRDLLRAGICTELQALQHWHASGQREGRFAQAPEHRLDPHWYLARYDDLQRAGLRTAQDAHQHWQRHGQHEGRAPNAHAALAQCSAPAVDPQQTSHLFERQQTTVRVQSESLSAVAARARTERLGVQHLLDSVVDALIHSDGNAVRLVRLSVGGDAAAGSGNEHEPDAALAPRAPLQHQASRVHVVLDACLHGCGDERAPDRDTYASIEALRAALYVEYQRAPCVDLVYLDATAGATHADLVACLQVVAPLVRIGGAVLLPRAHGATVDPRWRVMPCDTGSLLLLLPPPPPPASSLVIGVLIATYQRAHCSDPTESLRRALASVVRQTHRDWVLFLVGDHYADESLLRAAVQHAGIEPRRCVLVNLPLACEREFPDHVLAADVQGTARDACRRWQLWHTGGANAMNYALELCAQSGVRVAAHLDDDDQWQSEHLAALLHEYTQHNASFVYTCSAAAAAAADDDAQLDDARGAGVCPAQAHTLARDTPPRAYHMHHSAASWRLDRIPLRYRTCEPMCTPADADMWRRMAAYCAAHRLVTRFVPRVTVRYGSSHQPAH